MEAIAKFRSDHFEAVRRSALSRPNSLLVASKKFISSAWPSCAEASPAALWVPTTVSCVAVGFTGLGAAVLGATAGEGLATAVSVAVSIGAGAATARTEGRGGLEVAAAVAAGSEVLEVIVLDAKLLEGVGGALDTGVGTSVAVSCTSAVGSMRGGCFKLRRDRLRFSLDRRPMVTGMICSQRRVQDRGPGTRRVALNVSVGVCLVGSNRASRIPTWR